jgi:hypothetical protein
MLMLSRPVLCAFMMLISGLTPVSITTLARMFDEKKPSLSDGPKAEVKDGKKRVIRHPKSLDPPAPKPDPAPSPKPNPSASIKLNVGQFYVIGSNTKLVVLENAGLKLSGAGAVTITERKPPLTIPAEIAVGYTPDPMDPDVVTFNEPYLYIVKAKVIQQPNKVQSGPVVLQLIPAENETGTDGKLIPLTAADVTYLPIDVGAGQGPQPPPDPIPDPKPKPDPVKPDAALVAKFKDAIAKDLAVTGTVAKKEHVTKLASVYDSTARLVKFNDPAARPKTWKAVQQGMVNASRLAEVPPLPEFTNLRTLIEAEGGTYDATTPIDETFGDKLNATFVRIAAALNEAAK